MPAALAKRTLEREWGYVGVTKKQELPDCVVFFARNDRNKIVYIRANKDGTFSEHKSKSHAVVGVSGKPISKQRGN
jgi:hypothetical protein